MNLSGITLDRMTKQDVGFATELTEQERWGYLEQDFRRLIYFEPDGCFVARRDGKSVGIVTTTSYGDYAFLGCLIVKADSRGAGIGETLMRHAMNYLSGKKVHTVEIDGVFPALSLYRRLGFKDKYLSLRFIRPPTGKAGPTLTKTIRGTKKICGIEELSRFDERRTRIRRRRVLERFMDEFADSLYVLGKRSISAYAFIRPRSDGRRTIGPFVADGHTAAERLLETILVRYADTPLSMGVPEVNRSTVNLLLQRGFLYVQPSVRMFLGKRVDYEAGVYGILSPEKG